MLEPERILRLEHDRVVLLDQRKLPREEVEVECRTAADVAEAISTMVVRGAPAIGVAAAYGYALAVSTRRGSGDGGRGAARLAADGGEPRMGPRPDACRSLARPRAEPASRRGRALPPHGGPHRVASRTGTRALTHCNAGGLATGGYGSAVGALLAAWERGLLAHVFVDETRPLLQGARLTAWELETASIPHTVIADSAAASLMAAGEIDCVITGADRIAETATRPTRSAPIRSRSGPPPRPAPVHRRPDLDRRPREPGRRRDPDRRALAYRDHRSVPRSESRVRRDAREPDRRDRHRVRRAPCAVRRRAHAGSARRDESARPRGRVRDAPAPAHRYWAKELLPVGGRPILDGIVDRSAPSTRSTSVHVVTNARKAPAFHAWAEGRGVAIHDDGTSTERRPAGRDRRHAVRDRRGAGRRRPARDRGRQPVRLQPRRLRRLLAFQRGRERIAVRDVGDPRARAAVRDRRARARRSRARLPGEAGRSALDARRDRDLSVPPRATCRSSRVPRRRACARPAGPLRSHGFPSASRSTAGSSPRGGSTSATKISCSKPTTGCARRPACRSGRRTRRTDRRPCRVPARSVGRGHRTRHTFVAKLAQTCDTLPRSVLGVAHRLFSCRLAASPVAHLRAPSATVCRELAADDPGPALRALRRTERVAGRSLSRVRGATARIRLRRLGISHMPARHDR